MVEEHNKHESQGRVELDTDEARGATTAGRARYVLGFSLVLVIVVFFVIWASYR